MNITAAKDIPCVSMTRKWKGYFEAHFMSGNEINALYPILNNKWQYSPFASVFGDNKYDSHYFSFIKHFDSSDLCDPWYREIKNPIPVIMNMSPDVDVYHTTVESNPILLIIYKNI